MAVPTYATVTGTIAWSDGTPFDGFIVLAVIPPNNYTTVRFAGLSPSQRCPMRIRIPVVAGTIDANTAKIPTTTSYDPPNCVYAAWLYDANNVVVVAVSSSAQFFSVTGSTWTPSLVPSITFSSGTIPSLDT